ncbi:MAG: translocation/assembly module TamB domain-containing protein [Spirochaeta sp.]
MIVLLLAGSGAIALPRLHAAFMKHVENLQVATIQLIEESIDRPFSYGAIQPNIIRGISITDLRIYSDEERLSSFARIGTLQVNYSLWRLLRGEIQITDIQVLDADLMVQADDPSGLLPFFQGFIDSEDSEDNKDNGSLQVLFPDTAVLSFRRVRVTMNHEAFSGDISVPRATIRNLQSNPQMAMHAEFNGASSRLPDFGRLYGRVSIEGRIADQLSGIDSLVKVDLLETDRFIITDQEFGIQVGEEGIALRRRSARDPIEVQFDYSFAASSLQLQIETEGYRIGSLGFFRNDWAWLNSATDGSFNGTASLRYSIETASLQYNIDMNAVFPDLWDYGAIQTDIAAIGDQRSVQIRNAHVRTLNGDIMYSGNLSFDPIIEASGNLQIQDISYNNLHLQQADFRISTEQGVIQLDADDPQTSVGKIHGLNIEISPNVSWGVGIRGQMIFNSQRTRRLAFQAVLPQDQDFSQIAIRYTFFKMPGSLISAAVEQFLQQKLVQDIHTYAEGSDLSSSGIIFVEDSAVRIQAPYVRFTDYRTYGDTLEFQLQSREDSIIVQNIAGSIVRIPVAGSLEILQQSSGDTNISTELAIRDQSYAIEGTISSGGELFITGSHGLKLTAVGSPSEVIFQAAAAQFPLPMSPSTVYVDMSALGRFSSLEDFHLRFRRLSVDNAHLGPIRRISFPVEVTPTSIDSSEILIETQDTTYMGSLSAGYSTGSEMSLSGLSGELAASISSAAETEEYRIDAQLANENITGDFAVTGFPLPEYIHPDLQGTLRAQGELHGTLDAPEATGSLSLQDARFTTSPIVFNSDFSIGSDEMLLTAISGEYQGVFFDPMAVHIGFTEKRLTVDGEMQITDWAQSHISITTHIDGTFGNDWTADTGFLHRDMMFNSTFSVYNEEDTLLSAYSFSGQGTGNSLQIEGGIDGRGFFFIAEQGGDFEFDVYDPFPVQAQGFGNIQGDTISLDIPNLYFDASQVSSYLTFPEFSIHRGIVQGSLRLTGSARDPDFYGTLNLTDVRGDIAFSPSELHIPRSSLVFEERGIRLPPTQVHAGSTIASVSGGMQLSRFVPDEYRIEITTLPDHWFPVDYDFGAISVAGIGALDIVLSGNQNEFAVTGDITGRNTTIVILPMDSVTYDEGDMSFDFVTDLTFHTGRGVEFFWPNQQVPILRTFAKTGESIRLQSSTQDPFLSLTGSVAIQGGEIFYFQRSFYLREGSIIFDESLEDFDPRISLRAEIREVAEDGPITIILTADQNPLSQFAPRFSSIPSRPDIEILALLGQNVVGQRGTGMEDASGPGAFTLNFLDTVGQLAVSRTVESRMREALQLDMFSIRTPIIQNIGAPLDTPSPSLGQYLNNTSIFLGRYIGNDIFGEVLIQLRAQDPFSGEPRNLTGLEIDSEISLDFDTPYFNLEWSISPDNWDQLFIPDNQFSFTWSFSY